MPPPTTTPPPPPSFPLNLLPGAVFVLLPFLFLFRALLGAHARHNSSSSSTPEEEAASSSSSSSSSSVRRLKKKHVRWLLGPFRFQALPSRAMAALFRCLGEGSTGASALATTNAAIRTAVLRAQSTLTIAGGKAAAADEEEEGALLALLCRLSPDALTTVRIKRKGVATTVFLDALLEGPSVMPALFGPSLQEVSLDLSGCANAAQPVSCTSLLRAETRCPTSRKCAAATFRSCLRGAAQEGSPAKLRVWPGSQTRS